MISMARWYPCHLKQGTPEEGNGETFLPRTLATYVKFAIFTRRSQVILKSFSKFVKTR